jgi:hypothetical protein
MLGLVCDTCTRAFHVFPTIKCLNVFSAVVDRIFDPCHARLGVSHRPHACFLWSPCHNIYVTHTYQVSARLCLSTVLEHCTSTRAHTHSFFHIDVHDIRIRILSPEHALPKHRQSISPTNNTHAHSPHLSDCMHARRTISASSLPRRSKKETRQ